MCQQIMRYLDPVDQFSISNYAAFRNNPIAYVDPLGNAASKQTNQKLGNGDSQIMTDILEDGNSGLDVHASDEVTGLSKDYHVDDAVCVYTPKEKAPADNTYTESYATKAARLFVPLPYDEYGHEGELSGDIANMGNETPQGRAIGFGVVGVLSGGATLIAGAATMTVCEIALTTTSLLMNANSLTTDKSGNSTLITRTVNNETFTKVYGVSEFGVNIASVGFATKNICEPAKFLNKGNFQKVPTYFGLFPDVNGSYNSTKNYLNEK